MSSMRPGERTEGFLAGSVAGGLALGSDRTRRCEEEPTIGSVLKPGMGRSEVVINGDNFGPRSHVVKSLNHESRFVAYFQRI